MKDIKGRWSTLDEKQKDKYKQEAAALRAQGQDLSVEMRELKIKKNLNQLKLQVWKEGNLKAGSMMFLKYIFTILI